MRLGSVSLLWSLVVVKNPFLQAFGRPKRRDSMTTEQRAEIARRVEHYAAMVEAGVELFPGPIVWPDNPRKGEEVKSP